MYDTLARVPQEARDFKFPRELHPRKSLYAPEELKAGTEFDPVVCEGTETKATIRGVANPERTDGKYGDNFFALPELNAYAVFDGLSKSASDSESSKMAAEFLNQAFDVYKDELDWEEGSSSREEVRDFLVKVFNYVEFQMSQKNRQRNDGEKYMTTMTCSLVYGNDCFIVHTGDSQAFLLNKSKRTIDEVTLGHGKARESSELSGTVDEVANGTIDKNIATAIRKKQDEIKIPSLRAQITQALGKKDVVGNNMSDRIDGDIYVVELGQDDVIILASDGLTKTLLPGQLLFNVLKGGKDIGVASEHLMKALKGKEVKDDTVFAVISRN